MQRPPRIKTSLEPSPNRSRQWKAEPTTTSPPLRSPKLGLLPVLKNWKEIVARNVLLQLGAPNDYIVNAPSTMCNSAAPPKEVKGNEIIEQTGWNFIDIHLPTALTGTLGTILLIVIVFMCACCCFKKLAARRCFKFLRKHNNSPPPPPPPPPMQTPIGGHGMAVLPTPPSATSIQVLPTLAHAFSGHDPLPSLSYAEALERRPILDPLRITFRPAQSLNHLPDGATGTAVREIQAGPADL